MKTGFFIISIPANSYCKNVFFLDRGKDVHCTGAFRGLEGDQGTETRLNQPVPRHGTAAPQPLQKASRAGDQDSSKHANTSQGKEQ